MDLSALTIGQLQEEYIHLCRSYVIHLTDGSASDHSDNVQRLNQHIDRVIDELQRKTKGT